MATVMLPSDSTVTLRIANPAARMADTMRVRSPSASSRAQRVMRSAEPWVLHADLPYGP